MKIRSEAVDPTSPVEKRVEHKLTRIRPGCGCVYVDGIVDGSDATSTLTINEALARAQCLSDMRDGIKYEDEKKHLQDMIEQFIFAIKTAKEMLSRESSKKPIIVSTQGLPLTKD